MANSRHAFFGETTYLFENYEYVSGEMRECNKKIFSHIRSRNKKTPCKRCFFVTNVRTSCPYDDCHQNHDEVRVPREDVLRLP